MECSGITDEVSEARWQLNPNSHTGAAGTGRATHVPGQCQVKASQHWKALMYMFDFGSFPPGPRAASSAGSVDRVIPPPMAFPGTSLVLVLALGDEGWKEKDPEVRRTWLSELRVWPGGTKLARPDDGVSPRGCSCRGQAGQTRGRGHFHRCQPCLEESLG